MKEFYDVVVIGSGIAGMTAAIYLKRGGLSVLIIEKNVPGGQLNKINSIDNYPGFVKTDGPTLAAELFSQVRNLDIEYLFDNVDNVDLNSSNKKIVTGGCTIYCKYVVIATGRISRKLFDNDERYIGKGISYCALCDGNFYKEKEVIVVGGANSAVEEALYLSNICKKVIIVYRGSKLKAEEKMIDKLNNTDNIEVLYETEIKEYIIKDNKLDKVLLSNNKTLEVDGIFMAIGGIPNSEIFNLEKYNDYIVVDKDLKTSIDKVYACGEIIKKDIYQLTTAVGEASIVANNIIKEINNK